MEIAPNSHDHPLLFTDGESEDNQDELVICSGCRFLICGPRFSCFTCKFHLHKSCTELPPRLLGHPLHPQHALSLLPRPSYASNGYGCDACDGEGIGFVYHCSQCNFDLHIMCALSDCQEGKIVFENTGEKDYFPYGLQQHLLELKEKLSAPLETYNEKCFGCLEPISAPFYFCSRSRCKFWIHKFCANLPRQIKDSFLHPPEHRLFLVLGTHYCVCVMCGQGGIFVYGCRRCDFFIHPKCAFSNPRDAMKRVGEKHIQHRSHYHNLTLLEDEKEWAWLKNDNPFCELCCERLSSSPRYGCELCPFFLHKSCAELPGQIKSHLHPKHPLFLFARGGGGFPCNCCAREGESLNYRCVQCGFILHVDCFLSLHDIELSRYDHRHSFVDIKTFKISACDACGEEGYFSIWQCTACHLMVHKKCAEFSRLVRVNRHNHALKLVYFLCFVHECDKLICQLCYKEVNVNYAVYYCHLCKYATHLSCGQKIGVVVFEEDAQDHSNISFVDSSLEGSQIEGANQGGAIQHFNHQHELTLNEQDPREHKYCEGCVTLISSPFYNCKDCDFYLHKLCAEMPKTKKFPFHPHPLLLNPVEEIQYCYECEKDYNGFMYSCQIQDCLFTIDFHCVKLMDGIDHPCHEHRLFFPDPNLNIFETCKGCGSRSPYILVCWECEYVLGYCCAKLPHRIKHRYDDHLLSLALKIDDEYEEYYCDICENERDPKDWYYSCIKCDFFAHINCALGSFPYIKFGTTRTLCFHDHPLTYVEQPTRKPPPLCIGCDHHCYSKVLECSQCDFSLHIDCVVYPKFNYQNTCIFHFHEHLLTYVEQQRTRKPPPPCCVCGKQCYSRVLECSECDLFLHIDCVVYPKFKSGITCAFRFHEHLLTYVEQPTKEPPPLCLGCGGHCYSGVLECSECDFSLHIECVVCTKFKYRTKGKFCLHEHPHTYVEQPTRKPPPLCLGCGKLCYSRVLECNQCSFVVHFTTSCIKNVMDGSEF